MILLVWGSAPPVPALICKPMRSSIKPLFVAAADDEEDDECAVTGAGPFEPSRLRKLATARALVTTELLPSRKSGAKASLVI